MKRKRHVSRVNNFSCLDETSAAERKRAKQRSISDFAAYCQGLIESMSINERNVLHADFYGANGATRQAFKNRFDQEDLKKLM